MGAPARCQSPLPRTGDPHSTGSTQGHREQLAPALVPWGPSGPASPTEGLSHKPAPAQPPWPGSRREQALPGKQYLSLPLLDYLKEIFF